MLQAQQMMNQVKIDQLNQPMVQKQPTMNSSPMQGPQNIQAHVQNINAQSIAIQSQHIGGPPQSAQQMGQTQNQIQIQPIQQPNQMQPNQMQQIGVDPSGQMQFVNSAPPGNAANFNAMPPQQQQMKVVQQQQINIQHQQQPPPPQQQQMQVSLRRKKSCSEH